MSLCRHSPSGTYLCIPYPTSGKCYVIGPCSTGQPWLIKQGCSGHGISESLPMGRMWPGQISATLTSCPRKAEAMQPGGDRYSSPTCCSSSQKVPRQTPATRDISPAPPLHCHGVVGAMLLPPTPSRHSPAQPCQPGSLQGTGPAGPGVAQPQRGHREPPADRVSLSGLVRCSPALPRLCLLHPRITVVGLDPIPAHSGRQEGAGSW